MATRDRSWLRSNPISDEEFVEQIRRLVEFYQRWRWAMILLYGGLAFAFVGLCTSAANHGANLVQAFGNRWFVFSGFGAGAFLGLAVGHAGHRIGCGLVAFLSPPCTEQLLLRYYDAARESSGEDLGLNAPTGQAESG